MEGEKGTCEGCGTADMELNDAKKCVNCGGGIAAASTGDGESTDDTGTAGDESASTDSTDSTDSTEATSTE